MDDHLWMYRNSPKWLYRKDYCKGVDGFINFALSNLKNISRGEINIWRILVEVKLDVHVKSEKIKSSTNKMLWWCVLLKRVHWKIDVLVCIRKTLYSLRDHVRNIVDSTSSSSNIDEVVHDSSNCYRSLVIDTMRIDHGYSDEGSLVKEEPSVDAIRFFGLLKDSNEQLWDRCINHNKLSVIAWVFTTKFDYGMSEVDYDSIIK